MNYRKKILGGRKSKGAIEMAQGTEVPPAKLSSNPRSESGKQIPINSPLTFTHTHPVARIWKCYGPVGGSFFAEFLKPARISDDAERQKPDWSGGGSMRRWAWLAVPGAGE